MHRPRKELDWELFERICKKYPPQAIGTSNVAYLLDCSANHLRTEVQKKYGRNIDEVRDDLLVKFRMMLFDVMCEKALDEKDKAMMIFLSKNVMDMKDRTELTASSNNTFMLAYNIPKEKPKELELGREDVRDAELTDLRSDKDTVSDAGSDGHQK